MNSGFTAGMLRHFEDPPISLNFERWDQCLLRDGGRIHGDERHSVDSNYHGVVNGICMTCGQTYVWVGKEG